jgi:hypothetical protein
MAAFTGETATCPQPATSIVLHRIVAEVPEHQGGQHRHDDRQRRSRLLEKLGVSSVTELMRLAFDRPAE